LRAVTRFPQTRGEGCCESTPDAAAAYLKICALLVPKEMKLEHTNSVSSLSDEELDQAIAAIKAAARCKTKDRQQRPGCSMTMRSDKAWCTRRDLKLIAFLGAIVLMLGVVADRVH
jgi:hypothetical protein